MARFQAFVKLLTPDDPAMKMLAAGVHTKQQVGTTLGELLQRTGGVYEVTVKLGDGMRKDMRQAAQLTGDSELAAIAQNEEIQISFEHLRGLDPETRVIVRKALIWGPGEAARLGRTYQGEFDLTKGMFGAGSDFPEGW